MIARLPPDQRIVRQGVGVAVSLRPGDPALAFHHLDEAIGETEHHLFGRPGGSLGGRVEAADRARQSGDGGAAGETVLLQQQNARARPGGSECRRDAGCAAADHQDIRVEGQLPALVP